MEVLNLVELLVELIPWVSSADSLKFTCSYAFRIFVDIKEPLRLLLYTVEKA